MNERQCTFSDNRIRAGELLTRSAGEEPFTPFTPEELADIAVGTEKALEEYSDYVAWLRSPEGEAWAAQMAQEVKAIAAEFKAECASGKYRLTHAELEQLRKDGVLAKCHPQKTAVPTEHGAEFHRRLDALIDRYNAATGSHVKNDYFGL